MSKYIKRIQTTEGDKQIDYEALANLPVIDSKLNTSSSNAVQNKAVAAEINNVKSEVLGKTNTTEYTPTSDFHPATKKYVDSVAGNATVTNVYSKDEINNMFSMMTLEDAEGASL